MDLKVTAPRPQFVASPPSDASPSGASVIHMMAAYDAAEKVKVWRHRRHQVLEAWMRDVKDDIIKTIGERAMRGKTEVKFDIGLYCRKFYMNRYTADVELCETIQVAEVLDDEYGIMRNLVRALRFEGFDVDVRLNNIPLDNFDESQRVDTITLTVSWAAYVRGQPRHKVSLPLTPPSDIYAVQGQVGTTVPQGQVGGAGACDTKGAQAKLSSSAATAPTTNAAASSTLSPTRSVAADMSNAVMVDGYCGKDPRREVIMNKIIELAARSNLYLGAAYCDSLSREECTMRYTHDMVASVASGVMLLLLRKMHSRVPDKIRVYVEQSYDGTGAPSWSVIQPFDTYCNPCGLAKKTNYVLSDKEFENICLTVSQMLRGYFPSVVYDGCQHYFSITIFG